MKKTFKLLSTLFMVTAASFCAFSCDDDDPQDTTDAVKVAFATPTMNLEYTAGTSEMALTSDGDWTISVSPANQWLTVSPESGKGNATITVTVSENKEAQGRSATVTARGIDGRNTASFTVNQKNESGVEPPTGKPTIELGDGSDEYEITGDMTLTADNYYLLKGFVYVVDGVTLTIEPGTIIKGDKESKATLIVERGGKIMAQGTAEKPIVFTSSKPAGQRNPGDWGGIIICGKAPNNMGEQTIEGGVRSLHGGTAPADNSGVLSYVRCEFAGVEYSTDNEINGITFGSVGTGTKLDHLMVSHSGDDAFEWFGGTVNATHLVAFRTWDDDFDTDNGFSGKIQFAVGIRDPKTGDKSASNGFESDNNGSGSDADPHTSVVFANVSIFGPVADPGNYTDQAGVNGSTTDARFQAAMHLRRNTNLSVYNSLFVGYPIGLIIENDKGSATQGHATAGNLNVTNCVIAGMVKDFQDAQYTDADGAVFNPNDSGEFSGSYFNRSGSGNTTYQTAAELGLSGDYLNLENPGIFLTSASPLVSGANWTYSKVSAGFQQVPYIGAFSPSETAADNWMSGWCNFDPQNTVY